MGKNLQEARNLYDIKYDVFLLLEKKGNRREITMQAAETLLVYLFLGAYN
jgi:hypothetical protein